MSVNAQKLMQQAVALYQQQNYLAAEQMLRQLIGVGNVHPLVWHIYALSLRKLGRLHESESAFNQAIKIAPNDPEVHNNFGNLQKQKGNVEKALALFQQALDLKPGFADASYNAGLLHFEQKRFTSALALFGHALDAKPAFVSAAVMFASCCMELGQIDMALERLTKLINLVSDKDRILLSLAQCHRAKGQYQLAIECLRESRLSASCCKELATNLFLNGKCEEAEQILLDALKQEPGNLSLHQGLSEIRWLNSDTAWLKSYEDALRGSPENWALRCDLSNKLLKAGYLPQAEAVLNATSATDWPTQALLLKGHILREQGQLAAAKSTLEIAVSQSKREAQVLNELMLCYLATEDFDAANQLCTELTERYSENQAWWSMRAACLKLSGNLTAYRQLYDLDRFVKAYELPCPDGFTAITDFNLQLLDDLEKLHSSRNHPLVQSLRTGTQTEGHLFRRDEGSIKLLEQQLRYVVEQHIDTLPKDHTHPFLQRISREVIFSGAWSVRLNKSGFHRNHYHSEGWISGSYYVSVPNAVNQQGNGWIKFGQAELGRQISMQADYMIKPQAGTVVLFPSMMWHGTEPFDDNQYRVTVAFDIVPIKK
ncbi:tetratricopeptide repeat protein [Bowmanella denitrificans]|uniref:tetratricopeptide repeat protein n=1 Tax=Bowmanella denitrificans TaxID=366582 RepID=UPI000C9A95B7|nr:tetratricopeptide repeat protein [Bowmanella denitrificans]